MREIKFRAWDKQANRFVNDGDLKHYAVTLDGEVINFDSSGYDYIEHFDLVRYTGLKDKNGVEIYEGDVFHLDDDMAPAVVEYTNEMDEQGSLASEYCLALYEHGKRFQRLSMGEFYINKCEVIGNIYENPELLENPNA